MNKKVILLGLILTLSSVNSFSQKKEQTKSKKENFVRIFNEKKIHSGILVQTTDTSMFIIEKNKSVEVPLSYIKTIKLNRSFGHSVLIASLIGGAAVAILGAVAANPEGWFAITEGEASFLGFIIGAGTGAGLGSIITGTKSRPVYNIDQNPDNWEKVRPLLDAYSPDK